MEMDDSDEGASSDVCAREARRGRWMRYVLEGAMISDAEPRAMGSSGVNAKRDRKSVV